MILKGAVSISFILAAAVIESAIFKNIRILPFTPDLVLLALVYLSFLNGKTSGTILGFFSGIILDFLSGTPMGFNCLCFSLIGYLAGSLTDKLNFTFFLVPFLLGLCATLAKVFLSFLITLFFPKIKINFDIISLVFILKLTVNAFLSPLLFKFLGNFKNILLIKKEIDFIQ